MIGQLGSEEAVPEVASSVVTFGFSTTQRTKGHHLMSTREKLIEARMGMLALAERLNNVSAACRRAGISRSHYYENTEAFEKFGAEGLAPETKRKPRTPNQTPPEREAQILEMTEHYPTYSYLRISDQLKLVDIGVSPSTVRAVRQRGGLTLRIHRRLRLEQKTAAQGGIPNGAGLLIRANTQLFSRPACGTNVAHCQPEERLDNFPAQFPCTLQIVSRS
jgi:transposase